MKTMFSKIYFAILFLSAPLLLMVLVTSCDIDESQPSENIGFTRIYDDGNFESAFYPVDILQTADSGFIMLSVENDWDTYLLKTNRNGEFEWDLSLPEKYVNPIKGMFSMEGFVYFFCMDNIALGTYLIKVDPVSGQIEEERYYGDDLYPLAVSNLADGGKLLLGYNRNNTSSRLTRLNAGFDIQWSEDFNVLEDVEEMIIGHVRRLGTRYPFFTGTSGNRYFFNGFNNFSISLTFVAQSDGEFTGIVNGFRDRSVISSLLPISGSNYMATRYSYGENFLMQNESISENNISFGGDLGGNELPELSPDAVVFLQRITIQGVERILMATNTRSGQILLLFYSADGLQLIGASYLGRINPFEIGGITSTGDGGVAIMGNTWVAGRFPRICLFRLTADELVNMAK